MSRFIDLMRHGNATGTEDPMMRSLSPLGGRQARAFGSARQHDGEKYQLIVLSGLIRTEQTANAVVETIGYGPARISVPEMVDPKEEDWDKFSKVRNEAYTKLGSVPLIRYHGEAVGAMVNLGLNAAKKLRPIFQEHSGNILVIGHAVYTNEIILTTFFNDLNSLMKQRLLHDPLLTECAGYRLVFDDDGNLRDMLRLPQIILDV